MDVAFKEYLKGFLQPYIDTKEIDFDCISDYQSAVGQLEGYISDLSIIQHHLEVIFDLYKKRCPYL